MSSLCARLEEGGQEGRTEDAFPSFWPEQLSPWQCHFAEIDMNNDNHELPFVRVNFEVFVVSFRFLMGNRWPAPFQEDLDYRGLITKEGSRDRGPLQLIQGGAQA